MLGLQAGLEAGPRPKLQTTNISSTSKRRTTEKFPFELKDLKRSGMWPPIEWTEVVPITETEVVNELGKSISVGYQPIEYVDGKYLSDLIY